MANREQNSKNDDHHGEFVAFVLNDQRYALRLAVVERVVQVVEFTPLPKAPEIVLGIINFEGRVVPVVDVRKRFRQALCPHVCRLGHCAA